LGKERWCKGTGRELQTEMSMKSLGTRLGKGVLVGKGGKGSRHSHSKSVNAHLLQIQKPDHSSEKGRKLLGGWDEKKE